MSNFLAPIVRRHGGSFTVSTGTGPDPTATTYMGLLLNSLGEVLATSVVGAPHHFHNAMPFDVDGRLMVEDAAPVRWDQGIPFTANNMVSAQIPNPAGGWWDQGVLFTETGHISAIGAAEPEPPAVWAAAASENYHTGEGSYEFLTQFIGSGSPTFLHSGGTATLLLPDNNGTYVAISEDSPTVYGARWVGSTPYSDNGEGAPLTVQPSIYCAPARANAVTHSSNLTESTWVVGGGGAAPTVTIDEAGITGAANTATKVISNGVGSLYQNVWGQFTADSPISLTVHIKAITGGICTIENTRGAGSGRWEINLTEVSTQRFVTLTAEHPAVTETAAWVSVGTAAGISIGVGLESFILGNIALVDASPSQCVGAAPIINAGVRGATSAITIDYAVANHANNQGAVYFESTMSDADNTIDGYLSTTGANWSLSDGTTTTTRPWTAGTSQKVGVAYGGGQMSIVVDGVASNDVVYNGTLLQGALDLFRSTESIGFIRNIQRYDLSYEDAKAKLIAMTGQAVSDVSAVIYGDSFTAAPLRIGVLDEYVYGEYELLRRGVGGKKLAEILAEQFTPYFPEAGVNFVILQGGINDIYSQTALSSMQNSMQTMVDGCIAEGVTYCVIGIAPFKTGTNGLWTQQRQDLLDAYNVWAASAFGALFVPIYDVLESPAGSDALNPAYASPDLVHPNYDGYRVIDAEVGKQFL